jgi:hypothetical protein
MGALYDVTRHPSGLESCQASLDALDVLDDLDGLDDQLEVTFVKN